jgi:hypothetical protein
MRTCDAPRMTPKRSEGRFWPTGTRMECRWIPRATHFAFLLSVIMFGRFHFLCLLIPVIGPGIDIPIRGDALTLSTCRNQTIPRFDPLDQMDANPRMISSGGNTEQQDLNVSRKENSHSERWVNQFMIQDEYGDDLVHRNKSNGGQGG